MRNYQQQPSSRRFEDELRQRLQYIVDIIRARRRSSGLSQEAIDQQLYLFDSFCEDVADENAERGINNVDALPSSVLAGLQQEAEGLIRVTDEELIMATSRLSEEASAPTNRPRGSGRQQGPATDAPGSPPDNFDPQTMSEEDQCPICYRRIATKGFTRCDHKLCPHCLQGLLVGGTTISCPMCRQGEPRDVDLNEATRRLEHLNQPPPPAPGPSNEGYRVQYIGRPSSPPPRYARPPQSMHYPPPHAQHVHHSYRPPRYPEDPSSPTRYHHSPPSPPPRRRSPPPRRHSRHSPEPHFYVEETTYSRPRNYAPPPPPTHYRRPSPDYDYGAHPHSQPSPNYEYDSRAHSARPSFQAGPMRTSQLRYFEDPFDEERDDEPSSPRWSDGGRFEDPHTARWVSRFEREFDLDGNPTLVFAY